MSENEVEFFRLLVDFISEIGEHVGLRGDDAKYECLKMLNKIDSENDES